MIERAIIIVLDSVGAGEMPDAAEYGDVGSDTLGNIARKMGGLKMPNLAKLGLGNIHDIQGVPPVEEPTGLFCKMSEASKGKDTTIGHWEIAGLITTNPFPTYPDGFPEEVIKAFEEAIGTKTLGNYPASGTVIIDDLGEEHMKTGYPIVYTSADSVFQIAAHEEIIPIPRLYEICEIARKLLKGEHMVSRVIARPFIGQPGSFSRTGNRHDYAVTPPEKTVLNHLQDAGYPVIGVGKIRDIFNGYGVTDNHKMKDNINGLEVTEELLKQDTKGLIFTNLVDFDMKFGHRNDVKGYADALEAMDVFMPRIFEAMKPTDVLFITADHGCDPTTPSTDHSREYVPLLVWSKTLKGGALETRQTFADIAATIDDIFGLGKVKAGTSFKDRL
ncbi:MAG: phosphopentomutase [Firmicutes bacterium]|nr:phosphopentomutase [Bacillota bacterium]